MPSAVLTPSSVERLDNATTTDAYHWFTPFYPTIGLDAAQVWWLCRSVPGTNPTSEPVYQVATFRQDNPSTVSAFALTGSGVLTGPGEKSTALESIASALSTAFWVRFGLKHKASAAGLAQGDFGMQASFTANGEVLGTTTHDLFTAATQAAYVPITGLVPAAWFTKLEVAWLVEALTGNFKWRLAYRTAPTSTATAGAWAAITGQTYANTTGEGCTAELAQTLPTTDFWVQFGIDYALSGGSTPGGARITTIAGIRR